MPGPGMYVSDGKEGVWKPQVAVLRHPSHDANGVIPGPVIVGMDGKPVEAPDPAAVEAIKKELGFKSDDIVPLESLKVGVAKWEKSKAVDQNEALLAMLATMAQQQEHQGKSNQELAAILAKSMEALAAAKEAPKKP